MGEQAIQVAVRVRPLTEAEAARIPDAVSGPSFMGDGSLSGTDPSRATAGIAGYGGPGNVMREVVQVMDENTLVFDPPDKNAFSRAFLNGTLPEPERRNAGRPAPSARGYKTETYTFDNVFDKDATQQQVYEKAVKPMLDGLFDGYNATVFAYGATGCGKTHTISGNDADPGVIYRVMNDLFSMREASAHEYETEVTFSALEIYNENIYDLLVEGQTRKLHLREDGKSRVTVANLSSKQPASAEEVLDWVTVANQRRKQSPTHANAESSRSHAIIQISIARRRRDGVVADFEKETISSTSKTSTLSIIDLAGSERASATLNMGKRMVEGANINKSLLSLANVLNQLAARANMSRARQKVGHIPYRNSQLTRLLQFSLGGNCRTLMIACVSPCSANKEDISNTLKYAHRAMTISTSVTQNAHETQRNIGQFLKTIATQNATIAELQQQINKLKATSPEGIQENLDKYRAELQVTLQDMRQHVTKNMEAIVTGARAQAMRDAADARISALRARMSIIDKAYPAGSETPEEVEAVRQAMESAIRRIEAQTPLGNESATGSRASTQLSGLLRVMGFQSFGKLGKEETVAVELESRIHQAEIEKAKSTVREDVLQTAFAEQAQVNSKQLDALAKCKASLEVAGRELLKAISGESEETLESLVKRIAAGLLAVAKTGEAALAGSDPPTIHQAIIPTHRAGHHPARRMSTATVPGSAPSRPRQSVQGGSRPPVVPVNKRVVSLAQVGTPKRAIQSPRKRASAIPGSARARLGSAKKHMMWKDQAGSGRSGPLETIRTITPDTSLSAAGPSSSSASPETDADAASGDDEWQEEEEVAADTTVVQNASMVKMQLPAPTAPAVLPAEEAPIPEWKKNRLMMGKIMSTLNGHAGDSSVADTSTLRSMGPPQRPLTTTNSVLSSGPQRRVPTSAARAPLLTSQAAANNAASAGNPGPSRLHDLGRAAQRRSSIAPYSVAGQGERKRSRTSIVPIAEEGDDELVALAATLSPRQNRVSSASHPRLSLLPEGKPRAVSLGRSPKQASRRESVSKMPSALAGGAARHRQSISGLAGKLSPALAALAAPSNAGNAADASAIAFGSTTSRTGPSAPASSNGVLRMSPTITAGAVAPLRGPPPSLRKIASMAALPSTVAAGGESGAALRPLWKP